MGDTEYLISCVEAHPCVWDPTQAEYHDRDKKDAAWLDICRAVVPRWDAYTEQEKVLKRLDVKKKWSNCRDYYKKDVQRRGCPPAPDRRRRRYVFADHLSFLDRVIKGSEPYEANDDEKKQDDILIVEVGENGDEVKKIKITEAKSDAQTKNSQEMFKEFLNITNKTNKEHSDDERYLLSFRSEMQKMSHSQKIDFKLGMMQLVKNIFQDESTTQSNLSSPSSYSHKYSQSSYNTYLSPQYILQDNSSSE